MDTENEQESGRALHAMNPVGRFSDRAEAYRQFRPSYPAEALEAILDGLGDPTRLTAADVGAGTGISTNLLAERGLQVIAIEPNAAMRAAVAVHPRVRVVDGTAERTGLPSHHVDLALAAQSFHWFEPEEALKELHRVLRPNGRLAVLWNERDLTDPVTAMYADALVRASNRAPEERWHLRPEELYASRLFSAAWERTFRNAQELDAEGLIGRAMSASYIPSEGTAHQELIRSLRELASRFARRDGKITLVYRTVLSMSESVAPMRACGEP
ncbi:MAG: class I SAM-dependent methyltransferase [Phycisphaerae bacterium]|nr:class I SAM-dependent methyltransferase [Phycisphaerae bacterium]